MNAQSIKINKIEFAQRINQALDKEGFPPLYKGRIQLLADIFNLSHRGVGKWLSGETCPPLKKFPLIAEKLNINLHWLKTGEGAMVREKLDSDESTAQEVPLLRFAELDDPNAMPGQRIVCYTNTVGRTYAVKLDSDAMSPRFPPGTIVILDNGRIPRDGDFILVESNNFPSPVFRQLIHTDTKQHYLSANNPNYERLNFSQKDKVRGVLVQAIIMF